MVVRSPAELSAGLGCESPFQQRPNGGLDSVSFMGSTAGIALLLGVGFRGNVADHPPAYCCGRSDAEADFGDPKPELCRLVVGLSVGVAAFGTLC